MKMILWFKKVLVRIKNSRIDESLRYETWYKCMTGKCLHAIDISKIYKDLNK